MIMSEGVKAETGIIEQSLHSLLGEKYLAYALSTITARSLPDVRDGLKPVHRRLLFCHAPVAACAQHYARKSRPVSSATLSASFIRTGIRLSTKRWYDWRRNSRRGFPLVKGEGNFGSIDGDSAAAMRLHRGEAD